jgi:hypothetical protein
MVAGRFPPIFFWIGLTTQTIQSASLAYMLIYGVQVILWCD